MTVLQPEPRQYAYQYVSKTPVGWRDMLAGTAFVWWLIQFSSSPQAFLSRLRCIGQWLQLWLWLVACLTSQQHAPCVSGTGPLLGQRWDWSAGVSIPWLGEMESLVCNFCLNVAARKIVRADPSLRYTSLLLGRWATNKQQPLRKLYVVPHYDGSCGSIFLSHPVTVYWHRANPITDPSLRHTSMLLGR